MKIPVLVATFVLSTLAPTFAISAGDIAPAALVGKKLIFEIVNGGAPYATTGTWSGTFAATGNGFAIANITGDTVNFSTTYSAAVDGGYTIVSLPRFIDGQKAATLTLYTVSGVGHYEVSIQDLFGVSLNGTFTIGSASVTGPEISIQQPLGHELTDGTAQKNFGNVVATTTSEAKTFTIKNTGDSPLLYLAINKEGTNASDFIVSTLTKDQLAKGTSTTFTVKFKPTAFGTRTAILHIRSNDKNENPFDIKLTGNGVGIK